MTIINWLLRRLIIWPLADIAAWWDARPQWGVFKWPVPGMGYSCGYYRFKTLAVLKARWVGGRTTIHKVAK